MAEQRSAALEPRSRRPRPVAHRLGGASARCSGRPRQPGCRWRRSPSRPAKVTAGYARRACGAASSAPSGCRSSTASPPLAGKACPAAYLLPARFGEIVSLAPAAGYRGRRLTAPIRGRARPSGSWWTRSSVEPLFEGHRGVQAEGAMGRRVGRHGGCRLVPGLDRPAARAPRRVSPGAGLRGRARGLESSRPGARRPTRPIRSSAPAPRSARPPRSYRIPHSNSEDRRCSSPVRRPPRSP